MWWTAVLLVAPVLTGVRAETVEHSLHFVASSKEFVELKSTDTLAIDLRYASNNNFVGENLYGIFNKAYLHRVAAEKLARAEKQLQINNPKFRLVIFDALRPRSVQYALWDKVKGTAQEKYVAKPSSGSIHNFGFALDLSIIDESDHELDMGTPFDAFVELAQPRLEEKFLREGQLTELQLRNRHLLKKVMEDVGFTQLPIEWWHFDALPKSRVKGEFKIIE
jgi:D-alanyl-D-alanine dipeptidase